MADTKELKPKSFRIDDETADKFKEISSQIGGNQQETLAKLIEAFEFQSGKAILTDKKADIEQFEKYVTAITRMYMGSLEDNQNVTEIVRTEFDALLKSKDTTIQDLQEKLAAAKQVKEDATREAKIHSDENARLNSLIDKITNDYNEKLNNIQSMLNDKDNLNSVLTESCSNLKEQNQKLKDVADKSNLLEEKLQELQKDYEQSIKDKTDIEQRLKQEQSIHESNLEILKNQLQVAQDKAILEIEKSYQEKINKLTEEKQEEINKYQQKYLELLESNNKSKSK